MSLSVNDMITDGPTYDVTVCNWHVSHFEGPQLRKQIRDGGHLDVASHLSGVIDVRTEEK